MKLNELFRKRKQMKLMGRFVAYLARDVNLDMIEFAKGKGILMVETKVWKEKLMEEVQFLIPKFTYREWILILSIENGYQTLSKNKTEDVRQNLFLFLQSHYVQLYSALHLSHYGKFQTREKEEVFKIVMVENAYYGQKVIDAVLIHYMNGDRMCYHPGTGERLVVENIDLRNNALVIVLVDKSKSKMGQFLDEMKTFFEE